MLLSVSKDKKVEIKVTLLPIFERITCANVLGNCIQTTINRHIYSMKTMSQLWGLRIGWVQSKGLGRRNTDIETATQVNYGFS